MFKGARRTVAAVAAALGLGIGSTVWAATAASAAPSGIPPVCSTANLVVWVNVDEGHFVGAVVYYPLEFTNVSNHTCRTHGYPGVSATNAIGKQLGDAALRDTEYSPKWVDIPAGGTAHALFGYVGQEVSMTNCSPVNASYLSVYPPSQTAARRAFFDFPSCTKPHHSDLRVSVLQPGIGI